MLDDLQFEELMDLLAIIEELVDATETVDFSELPVPT